MRTRQLLPAFVLLAAPLLAAPTPTADATPVRKAVAVLRFDNNTSDAKYDNLGRGLAAMMISDLSVVEELQLVERERMEEIQTELDLSQSGMVDPETAQQVGLIVGAEYVVTGAFMTVDPEMRLDTRVVRVETTEIVKTADVRGPSDDLFDLQEELASELIDGIEVVLTAEDRERLRERQRENRIGDVETMLAFSSALCLLDHGAYVQALEEMQEVQESVSGSALVDLAVDRLKERAAESAKDRVVEEANNAIGNLLGRRPKRPERRERPLGC